MLLCVIVSPLNRVFAYTLCICYISTEVYILGIYVPRRTHPHLYRAVSPAYSIHIAYACFRKSYTCKYLTVTDCDSLTSSGTDVTT